MNIWPGWISPGQTALSVYNTLLGLYVALLVVGKTATRTIVLEYADLGLAQQEDHVNYFSPITLVKGLALQCQIGIREYGAVPADMSIFEFRAGLTADYVAYTPVQILVDQENALITLVITEAVTNTLEVGAEGLVVIAYKNQPAGRAYPLGTIKYKLTEWGFTWSI